MNLPRVTSSGHGRLRGPGGGPDGRGQSEIIGIIVMVSIVVILAALVGQYVFGLNIVQSGEPTVGPQASFATTVEDGDLTIEHQSGETVATDRLTVVGSETGAFDVDWAQSVGDEWTASESITITPQDGETVRIIWEEEQDGDSVVLLKERFEA